MPEGAFPAAFGIVTACNPDAVTVSEAANVEATERLRARLVAEGWDFFPVTGGSADFTHAEPGFGIVTSRDEIVAFGARVSSGGGVLGGGRCVDALPVRGRRGRSSGAGLVSGPGRV